MNRKRKNIFGFLIWISVGFIISMIFTGMYISEDGNMDCFYNIGEVYDVERGTYAVNGEGWVYDAQSRNFLITEKDAYKQIEVVGEMRSWNFCIMEISGMDKTSMTAVLDCIDAEGVVERSIVAELQNGRNQIFTEGVAFSKLVIRIPDAEGTQFELNKLQLRNQDPDASIGRIIKLSGFAFGIYAVLSLLIDFVKKKRFPCVKIDPYGMIEGLQKIFCKIANLYGKRVKNISSKIRERVWRSCFFILIFYSIYVIDTNQHLKLWKYSQIIYAVIILVIAVFSIEDEIKPVCWKNRLVYAWMALWILAAISDFIVSKKFTGVGYVQIFVWGFCFLIWNNMKQPHRIIKALMDAVRYSFIVTVIFCVFCRPEIAGGRYMGIFINPNPFANYLVVVAAALLTDITNKLVQEKNKRILWNCVELLAVLTFLWKTQTRGAMLAIGTMGILACWYLIWSKKKKGYRLLSKWVMYMAVLFLPVYGSISWGITTIPYKLDTGIVMENDFVKPAIENFGETFKMKVYAAEATEGIAQSRVVNSLKMGSLEEISSGRTIYWKVYIRNMNLWGHEWKAIIVGKGHDAHNSLLAIAYRYGIFTIIPYVIMWIYSIIYAVRYAAAKKKSYGFLPLALCIGYMIVSLIDAEEQPYINFVWFTMYFMIGGLFNTVLEGKAEVTAQSL